MALTLASVPPFSELPPVDRAKLAAALEELVFDEGDVVFAEGEPPDGLYILRDGLLERKTGGVLLARLEPPAVFGDLALLRDETRSATLIATTPCVVWRLPAQRFTALLKTAPGIGARFAAAVSHRLASSQQDVARLAQEFEDLAERLYAGLSSDEQMLLERAAILPRLDPRVVDRLAGEADGERQAGLPLSDVALGVTDGARNGEASHYPAAFRRFLLRRLEQRLGMAGVQEQRRELAAVARAVGAFEMAVEILVDGGLLAEALDLARREAAQLESHGQSAAAQRLLRLSHASVGPEADLLGDVLEENVPAAAAHLPQATSVPRRSVQRRWWSSSRAIALALGVAALAVGWFVPPEWGLSVQAWRALLTLVSAVPVLALNALPEGVVALALGALWVVGGVAPTRIALGGFASAGWVLVVTVLIMGAAMASSGLLYRLALWAVAHARGGYPGQVAALALAGVALGPANPNATGRVMLIAPAVSELVEALGYPPKSRGAVGLAMAVLAGFGQMVSPFLTSSTTAVLVYAVLPEASRAGLNWATWTVRAAPTNIVLFVGMVGAVLWIYRPRSADRATDAEARRNVRALALQRELLGPMSRRERIVLCVSVGVLLAFVTQPLHGIDPGWVGVAAVVALAATGGLGADDLRSVNWSFALFFGILPSMADVMAHVQLDTWIGGLVSGAVGGLATTPVVFVAVLTLLCFAISFVLRWQAAAPLLTVALTPVAIQAGMDPWIVGMVALIGCNGFFLPYQSTTYLALYAGTGGRLFTNQQARPMAIAQGVMTLIALCVSVPFWHLMGLL